jgi:hypothetical protein
VDVLKELLLVWNNSLTGGMAIAENEIVQPSHFPNLQ